MNVSTYTLGRGNDREPMSPEKLSAARARYWANVEHRRAIARKSYYKHLEKNRAAARERERLKRLAKMRASANRAEQ